MEGLKGRVGFVAIGAYGGNQGELFYKAKYPVVFINTAQQDLDSLTDIPDSDKYHIPGGEGCSKDRNKSKTIFSEDLDNVVNVIKEKLVGLDYIFIIGSCGGALFRNSCLYEKNHCIRAGTEGLHGNNGITEHTDRITESSGKCVQHFM